MDNHDGQRRSGEPIKTRGKYQQPTEADVKRRNSSASESRLLCFDFNSDWTTNGAKLLSQSLRPGSDAVLHMN